MPDNQSAVPVSQRAREVVGGNNPLTDRAREVADIKAIVQKAIGRAIRAQVDPVLSFGIEHRLAEKDLAASDAAIEIVARYERDILAGQSVGDYVLAPREQIERLATKEPGYGMAYHAKGIRSNGSAEIHLYGKRAEAAHWLMENGMSLAAPIAPAPDSPAIPERAQWETCACSTPPYDDEVVYDQNLSPRCPRCNTALGGDPMTASERAERDAEDCDQPTPASHTAPIFIEFAPSFKTINPKPSNQGAATGTFWYAEGWIGGERFEFSAQESRSDAERLCVCLNTALTAALATPAPSRDEVERDVTLGFGQVMLTKHRSGGALGIGFGREGRHLFTVWMANSQGAASLSKAFSTAERILTRQERGEPEPEMEWQAVSNKDSGDVQ